MKQFFGFVLLSAIVAAPAAAEDVLYIGNSYTSYNDLPRLVQVIAVSKRKAAAAAAITPGGADFAAHLTQPATDVALTSKPWHFVVLQDQSLRATRLRGAAEFLGFGEQFYRHIAQRVPQAKVVLYETWAYGRGHAIYTAQPGGAAPFADPDAMYAEIHANYSALQSRLQAIDATRTVLLAPVGAAFQRCTREHPQIELYEQDRSHPSPAGSYLAALVIYATLFNDSPVGAAAGNANAQIAKALQETAAAITTAGQ
jgi:hypothetical protein